MTTTVKNATDYSGYNGVMQSHFLLAMIKTHAGKLTGNVFSFLQPSYFIKQIEIYIYIYKDKVKEGKKIIRFIKHCLEESQNSQFLIRNFCYLVMEQRIFFFKLYFSTILKFLI